MIRNAIPTIHTVLKNSSKPANGGRTDIGLYIWCVIPEPILFQGLRSFKFYVGLFRICFSCQCCDENINLILVYLLSLFCLK